MWGVENNYSTQANLDHCCCIISQIIAKNLHYKTAQNQRHRRKTSKFHAPVFALHLLLQQFFCLIRLPLCLFHLKIRIFPDAEHGALFTPSGGAVVATGPHVAANLLGGCKSVGPTHSVLALADEAGLSVDILITPVHLEADQLIVRDVVDAVYRTGLYGHLYGLVIVTL